MRGAILRSALLYLREKNTALQSKYAFISLNCFGAPQFNEKPNAELARGKWLATAARLVASDLHTRCDASGVRDWRTAVREEILGII